LKGDNNGSGPSRAKYIGIMIGFAVIIVILVFIKFNTDSGIVEQVQNNTNELQNTKMEVNKTQKIVNETKIVVNQTKQEVGKVAVTINDTIIPNQAILAKGVSDGINAALGKINGVANQTKLIDDIKFAVDKIANETKPVNITIPSLK
jgi:predicted PurR-regulated permease PerM